MLQYVAFESGGQEKATGQKTRQGSQSKEGSPAWEMNSQR
jgi:hypothetical protein